MHLWSVAQFQSSALGGFPVCCCTHPERMTGIEQLTRGAFRINDLLKFGFSEKATKFEKNLPCTFDKSVVFCARNSVLVKKSTKIFQNKCGQVVLYKLYEITLKK
jgi:hypothetical protein